MSSKKCFDFITGGSVRIAPETKVVPAQQFSQLVNALEVLEKLKEDGEHYKIAVIEECERLKAQAQQEGFNQGFQSWLEVIARQEAEIEKVSGELQKVIAPVALKAAKKIVGKQLEISEESIVDIVQNSLKAVAQHKKIVIYVNKKDLKVLEANKPKLKEIFEELETLSIQERSDVAPGGVIIESEKGVVNAQLENQWRILENVFGKLFAPKKEATEEVKK